LVTGGAGFIGSHLVDALAAAGHDVDVLDDLSTGRRENLAAALGGGRVRLIEGSACDAELVTDLVDRADCCFHLAAAVGVQLICERPLDSLLVNVRSCELVMGAAARSGTRLIFASTSEIYGKNSRGPLREDDDRVLGSTAVARWGYAHAKSIGEMIATGYARDQGAEMAVARLFNVIGPRQSGAYGMVVPRLVGQALNGDPLTVYGDGSQTRCFVHVLDVVEGLRRIADSDEALGSAYNVGSEDELTINRLARLVIERTESSSDVAHIPYDEAYPTGFEELGRRRPDTTAIRELTGWTPLRTVGEAIDDVAAHWRGSITTTAVP
jgi:UDP-glucose 4-epimerase